MKLDQLKKLNVSIHVAATGSWDIGGTPVRPANFDFIKS
jgi:hypothetical protein